MGLLAQNFLRTGTRDYAFRQSVQLESTWAELQRVLQNASRSNGRGTNLKLSKKILPFGLHRSP